MSTVNRDWLSVGDWIKYSTPNHPNRDGIILTMGQNSCTVQCIDLNVIHTSTDTVKYECIENVTLYTSLDDCMDARITALCKL